MMMVPCATCGVEFAYPDVVVPRVIITHHRPNRHTCRVAPVPELVS